MSRRTAAWLAWSVWAVCVVLITLTLVLDFTTEELPLEVGGFRYDPGFAVLTGVLSLAYPAVGALIASRLPTNPIGWIFCGLGLIYVTQRFAIAYADHALLETLALPWGEVRGLVLHVDKVREPHPGSIPDAFVSQRSATVSSVAHRGVADGLGSRHERAWGRLHAGYSAPPQHTWITLSGSWE